ncbi:hypothetical protein FDF97_16200 [Clostridium botulinum]|uniref:Uncharacterized protein n=1 Tax=Clostridium botulinum TaxID=1491 RepID=A0AA43Y9N2_CLOBO|nr:hypothetical protein [Clostridium botulinum]NFI22849.1 hypothetical protein [Clostridium botulinum]NFQ79740.1 hypothetical protein [Clostridium botulinum]
MMNMELVNMVNKKNSLYTEDYLKLDPAIEPLVNYINNYFPTVASCSSHKNRKGKYIGNAYVLFYLSKKDIKQYFDLKQKLEYKGCLYNVVLNLYCVENGNITEKYSFIKNQETKYLGCVLEIKPKFSFLNREKLFMAYYKECNIPFLEEKINITLERENYRNTINPSFSVYKYIEKEPNIVKEYKKQKFNSIMH